MKDTQLNHKKAQYSRKVNTVRASTPTNNYPLLHLYQLSYSPSAVDITNTIDTTPTEVLSWTINILPTEHYNPPLNPTPNHKTAVQTLITYFNILPGGLVPSSRPIKSPHAFHIFPVHATCPAHVFTIKFNTLIISDKEEAHRL
jgi:hypothetical protein